MTEVSVCWTMEVNRMADDIQPPSSTSVTGSEGMLLLNGNEAAATGAMLAGVSVVPGYPITPSTGVLEHFVKMSRDGSFTGSVIPVESEHSSLSLAAGAALMGSRSFTATSSQGLQHMSEVLHWTSGMRLPVVMAVATRTLSSPVSLRSDHQDIHSVRETGWIQFMACSAQEVLDAVMAMVEVTGALNLPGMVAYDGYSISHAREGVSVPLPLNPLPRPPLLDVVSPVQLGMSLPPSAYPFADLGRDAALIAAHQALEEWFRRLGVRTGRTHTLVERIGPANAGTVMVAIGGVSGTIRSWLPRNDTALVIIRLLRPFPTQQLCDAIGDARRVVVVNRALDYGVGGPLTSDVVRSLYGRSPAPILYDVVLGLGGHPITPETLDELILKIPGHDTGSARSHPDSISTNDRSGGRIISIRIPDDEEVPE